MTNGEKIKVTFPHYDIEIEEHKGYVRVFYEDFYTTYPLRWWNAEYKEPTTKNDLGVDCISRAEAIKCLECDFDITGKENMKTVVNYINSAHNKIVNLPSVKQEPRKGHWIKGYTFPDGAYWKCDKCNELIKVKIPMRYCNNCGAKMVEPQESEVEDGNDD